MMRPAHLVPHGDALRGLVRRTMAGPVGFARWSLARCGYHTGMYARRLVASERPIILTYHGVIEEAGGSFLDRLSVTARTFRRQLEELGRLVEFVDVAGLLATTRSRRPRALVSFDDGFATVHRNASSILRQLGIPAIVNVPAGLVGTERTIWSLEIDLLLLASDAEAVEMGSDGERRRYPLRNRRERERARRFARRAAWAGGGDVPLAVVNDLIHQCGPERFHRLLRSHENLRIMNVRELRDLARNGFEIAAHGYYHLGLATLSAAVMEREVCEARSRLTALLPDTPIDVFCLPYGSASPSALACVRQADFRACLTTDGGRVGDDPWLLPRFDAGQAIPALLRDLARSR